MHINALVVVVVIVLLCNSVYASESIANNNSYSGTTERCSHIVNLSPSLKFHICKAWSTDDIIFDIRWFAGRNSTIKGER